MYIVGYVKTAKISALYIPCQKMRCQFNIEKTYGYVSITETHAPEGDYDKFGYGVAIPSEYINELNAPYDETIKFVDDINQLGAAVTHNGDV